MDGQTYHQTSLRYPVSNESERMCNCVYKELYFLQKLLCICNVGINNKQLQLELLLLIIIMVDFVFAIVLLCARDIGLQTCTYRHVPMFWITNRTGAELGIDTQKIDIKDNVFCTFDLEKTLIAIASK